MGGRRAGVGLEVVVTNAVPSQTAPRSRWPAWRGDQLHLPSAATTGRTKALEEGVESRQQSIRGLAD